MRPANLETGSETKGVTVMLTHMARSWWALALRGVIGVLFGLTALFHPGSTIAILLTFFGAYILVNGIFTLVAAFRFSSQDERWGTLLVAGILGILIGGLVMADPNALAKFIVYIVAAWAVVSGIMEIVAAVRLRREVANETLLLLTGILSLLLGIALFIMPSAGIRATGWLIGIYALLFGFLQLGLAWRLRGVHTTSITP